MKRELRDEWTARLRSGKLTQGQGALRDVGFRVCEDDEPVDRYCCLGVLCEIGVEQGRLQMSLDNDQGVYWTQGVDDRQTMYLPDTWNRQEPKLDVVIEMEELTDAWADLSTDWDGTSSRVDYVLAQANDNGYSFEQIADLIELIVPVEED